MAAVAPGQDPQQQHPQQTSQQSPPHGKKRAADNGLEAEQRLSKRFDLLNIGMHLHATSLCILHLDSYIANLTFTDNGTRLYITVAGSSSPAQPSKHVPKPTSIPSLPVTQKKRPHAPRPPPDDSMQVEDTPHRVYIHDLAAELSDLESDEENPIFLSDIEKHIAKIPKHVLMGPRPTQDNQIVLYNVPSSLTVPEEQDSVRKAIVEARARVRERQGQPAGEPERANRLDARGTDLSMEAEDSDAMDID